MATHLRPRQRVEQVGYSTQIRTLSFYLTDVAKTWFWNQLQDLPDWDTFARQLRQIFGSPSVRAEVAVKKLAERIQPAGESYTSYIEDVLALCTRVNSSMPQSDQICHIIKGINTVAFNALASQKLITTDDVITICQRLDELQSLRPFFYHDASDIRLPAAFDICALVCDIVRRQDLYHSLPVT